MGKRGQTLTAAPPCGLLLRRSLSPLRSGSLATMCQTIARIADAVQPVVDCMATEMWKSGRVQRRPLARGRHRQLQAARRVSLP